MLSAKLSFVSASFNNICRNLTSWQLVFNKHGEPTDVLHVQEKDIGKPTKNEVIVNFRAAPINPSDINAIQGTYPLKPQLPGIAGNEGAGYVLSCGDEVKNLKPGDLVIPSLPCLGTWRSAAILQENQLIRLNPKLNIAQAAFINTNPSTAYLLLTTFLNLKSGDFILQNGATSAVGIYVMQICRIMGLKSINLFRSRSTQKETEETRERLLKFGGSVVMTEEELKHSSESGDIPKVKIAFNCLGGKPTLSLIRQLDHSGILVTYGGMTRNPIPLPIGPLIFKDIQLRGFWLSSFAKKPDYINERLQIFDSITNWLLEENLVISPFDEIDHKNWTSGIEKSIFKDETPTTLPRKNLLRFPDLS